MPIIYIRFAAHSSDDFQRSPLLERLLARASTSVRVSDWRADALRLLTRPDTPMPAVAAAALQTEPTLAAAGAWVCIATPVHLSAGMSSVSMPRNGILELLPAEAHALADDFNRVFRGATVRLAVGKAGSLLGVFDQPLTVQTSDPELMPGRDLFGFQPAGPDGPRLRTLMSEIEMWLFDHAVNRARLAQARLPVTSLWLWGGAPAGASVLSVRGWTAGRDPFFSAFGSETQLPAAGAGAGVVTSAAQPGSTEWADVEQRWLIPGAARLQSRQLKRLELSAAGMRFSVPAGLSLRFWRRPRPWWESYGIH